uniref:NADH-ubiquinone oxidoreductase chain 3 n=1 Tax=Platypodinae sp. BMNH 1274714 TaxID=2558030 RepID=A0A126TG97_9CUCU|nr:NADH dehydrogenase subunit 3 [Platypodinae sp. BMNH 1274714]
MLMMISMIICMVIIILIFLLNMTAKKKNNDREKSSPFECGFEPFSSPRMPFSIHFFIIAIIFVIFDVELVLLFPTIPSMKLSNPASMSITIFMFILILLMGLYHEWNKGALNWK